MAASENKRESRDRYPHFSAIPTRWMDNDIYAHVNNVIYYAYFDTVINTYLIDLGGFDIHATPVIGLCVESGCRYHVSVAFPDRIDAGLRVTRLGNSSVRYEVGLFRNDDSQAAADGHFVHVFVDRETRRPHPVPDRMRTALRKLLVDS